MALSFSDRQMAFMRAIPGMPQDASLSDMQLLYVKANGGYAAGVSISWADIMAAPPYSLKSVKMPFPFTS